MIFRLKIGWLHSRSRQKLLTFRYFSLGQFFGKKAYADVYLALNDPHSFMLVQMLARLEKKYQLELKVFFIFGASSGVTIAPNLYGQWAVEDANLIAKRYQLVKIDKVPSFVQLSTGQQAWQSRVNNIKNAEQVFLRTWSDAVSDYDVRSASADNRQVKNQARLEEKGHYCAATLYFAGDWYLGVDRLFHFESALQKLGLTTSVSHQFLAEAKASKDLSNTQSRDDKMLSTANVNQQLEIFLSLRSPYSYLGFVQAVALAERYQLELIIKPVLPLLMRGASIPIAKQKYIYLDALREAQKLNIEFNGFADPLGTGVINAYSMFAWAEQYGKGKEYMLACFRAVYVDNIDLSYPENIDNILNDLALDKEEARTYQEKNNWQHWADSNQEELTKLAFWGVPCFKFESHRYWGQDRIQFLEKEIKLNLSSD